MVVMLLTNVLFIYCITNDYSNAARYWSKIVIFSYPTCAIMRYINLHLHYITFDACVRGGGCLRRNIVITLNMEKLEWCGYPIMKTLFEDTGFDRIGLHERDGRTDGRTEDTA